MCSRTLPPKVKRFTLREEGTAKRGLPLFTSLISRNINIMWVFATEKENFYRQVDGWDASYLRQQRINLEYHNPGKILS